MKCKKFNIYLFILLFITSLSVSLPMTVNADSNHKLDLTAYVCDYDEDTYTTSNAVFKQCLSDYKKGNLSLSYKLSEGSDVNPGSYILFIINYHIGAEADVNNGNIGIVYDPSVWVSYYTSSGKSNLPEYDADDNEYNWTYSIKQAEQDGNGYITVQFSEDDYEGVLDSDTEMGYFGLQLAEDASGNPGVEFVGEEDNSPTTLGTNEGVDSDYFSVADDATNLSFTIPSSTISSDASLKTLTVKNGDTTYPFAETFTAGSTTVKDFTTIVPNDVTSIVISATANDSTIQALTGTGTKTLSVGNNEYTLSVTSAYGNIETYTVSVYRLSNDATLSSISATNSISFGNMVSGTYTYSTTVPYAITSTTLSVTPTHEFAYIDSGTGDWAFTNYGSSINSKTIVVKAENCLSEYSSVTGNTCTSQNYTLNVTREEPSTNAYLSNLTVNSTQVTGFNKTVYEYDLGEVSYDTSTISINATVEDTSKASVSGLGTKTLALGENSFDVVTLAEDGKTTLTYTIKVYRLNNDATLSSLTVSSTPTGSFTPTFSSTSTEYYYTYDATVTSVTINATVNDTTSGKATVAIYDASSTDAKTYSNGSTSGTFGLSTSQVIISVIAEDTTEKQYVVNLSRSKSSDDSLSSLSVDGYTITPTFLSTTKEYSVTIPANVSSITINAVPNSAYGSIGNITNAANGEVNASGSSTNLEFGDNRIAIVVNSETCSDTTLTCNSQTYYVNATREYYTDTTLQSISYKYNETDGYTTVTGFDPDTIEYTLDTVRFDTTGIYVTASVDSSKYITYEVEGADTNGLVSLNTGDNTINIIVTAHDGKTTSTYKLKVERTKNSDTSISNLTVKGYTPTLTETENVYELTVPYEVSSITADDVTFTYPDDASNVTKDASLTLKTKASTTNANEYLFSVTAEDGTTITKYKINIYRESHDDATITKMTMTIDGDSSRYCIPTIEDGKNVCKIEVPDTTTEFSIYADISDDATISPAQNTSQAMSASESEKEYEYVVTAENNETKTYYLVVSRIKSSNANLKSLKIYKNDTSDEINYGTFSSTTESYEFDVDGDTESVVIEAEVEDTGKASINTDLSSAFSLDFDTTNKITIEVKAEDGTLKHYYLYITRLHRKDATLSDLTINGTYYIDSFTKNDDGDYVLDYGDVVYNTTSLNIVATVNDSNAAKGGDGLISLSTGSHSITITVTAHDTTVTQNYIINYNRALNTDKRIKTITIKDGDNEYTATADSSDSTKYTVTVPYSISEVNTSNLIVEVYDGATTEDKKAEVSFTSPTALLTTSTNDIPIRVTAENKTYTDYTLTITREKNDDATLSSLTVTDGSFDKSFNKDTTEYTVTIPVDATGFTVSAVATDSHATITEGTGYYEMDSSSSTKTVLVKVTLENGKENKTYTLTINRVTSSTNTLSSIIVSNSTNSTTTYDLDPTFASGETTYNVTIPGDVESVDITATLTDTRGSYTSSYTSTVDSNTYDTLTGIALKAGTTTTVKIVVTSESGATNTYTINLTREKKSNADLKSLSVTSTDSSKAYILKYTDADGNIIEGFNKDITEYTIDDLDNSISSLKISAEAEDTDVSSIIGTGNSIDISVGTQTIKVIVTAQDGKTTKTYNITVTRKPSTNNLLKSLQVSRYSLNETFSSTTNSYTIDLPYSVGKLNSSMISASAQDSSATITYSSEITLDFESYTAFKITVTAQSGDINTYTISAKRTKSSDATLASYTVTVGSSSNTTNVTSGTDTYTVTVPYGTTSFNIVGTPTIDETAVSYKGSTDGTTFDSTDGTFNTSDVDSVLITTVSQDLAYTKTYTFNIVVSKSNDALLSSLSIQGYPFINSTGTTIDFSSTTYTYSIGSVPYGTESLIVNATPNNSGATLVYYVDGVEQSSNTVNLPETTTTKTIAVKVTAADGTTTKTYSISYNLAYSKDAYLTVLKPSDSTLSLNETFSKTLYTYTMDVSNSVESVQFYIETEDKYSSISINGGTKVEALPSVGYTYTYSSLVVGSNVLTIVVYPADSTADTVTYTVTITRSEPEASSNADLSNLYVTDYPFVDSTGSTVTFSTDTLDYSIGNVPYALESLTINATLYDTKGKIEYYVDGVKQSSNVVTLSKVEKEITIEVIVTAEDNTTTKEYKITLNKVASTNALLASVTTSTGTLTYTDSSTGESISGFNSEIYSYNVTVDSETTEFSLTATLDDKLSSMTINGIKYTSPQTYKINSLEYGTTKVVIVVTSESGKVNTYNFSIYRPGGVSEVITSDTFGHTIENGYIETVRLDETVSTLKSELDNDDEYLSIWTADGTTQLSDTDTLATAMIVKLTIDGVVKDTKLIVIKGDTVGDGDVELFDAVQIVNHVGGIKELTGAYKEAALIDSTDEPELFDAVQIVNHVGGIKSLY